MHARTPAFARRLAEARERIREALAQSERPYIAYSTGKDSTCTAHLVWEQVPDTPGVYFDAECAYPESYALLDRMEAAGRPITRWSCRNFLEILQAHGGPHADDAKLGAATMEWTVYEPIRRLLAERRYDCVFLGLRAEENVRRQMLLRSRGLLFQNARDGILECCPIGRWSYQDVWAYIHSRGIDYCAAYDRMEEMPLRERRISYWAGETNRQRGRWAWLRLYYPDLFNMLAQRCPEATWYA